MNSLRNVWEAGGDLEIGSAVACAARMATVGGWHSLNPRWLV